jgi:ferredoxin--NADP+ reductase
VLDLNGKPVPGVYVNGWVKRGPVGLIGHTKGDAIETVGSLLADLESLPTPADPSQEGIVKLLEERGLTYTTWEGWERLDAHEIALGTPHERARIKVVDREGMLNASGA